MTIARDSINKRCDNDPIIERRLKNYKKWHI
jgi:hypothetical protein